MIASIPRKPEGIENRKAYIVGGGIPRARRADAR